MFCSVFFTDRKKISDFKKTIQNLPRDAVIIIREYDLPKNEREDFAIKIAKLARNQGLRVLVGKDLNLAKKIKADGVHFSDFDKLPLRILRVRNFIFSFACHNLASVIKAKKLQPDMLFISPIFPTTSHENTKPRGILYLAKIVTKYKNIFPIYALGGVNHNNIKSLRKLGIAGFGAINFFKK